MRPIADDWIRRCSITLLFLAGCGGSATLATGPTGGNGGGTGAAGGSGVVATTDAGSTDNPPALWVTLRTIDTNQYLSSGPSAVLDAASYTAGNTETFAITDINGGDFVSGDSFYLADAGKYLSAANGGGGALSFSAATAGADETFVVTRIAGAGTIAAGDQIAFATKVTGNYVSAIDGGGGDVLANAPWDKAWETYTLALPAAASNPPDGGVVASNSARAKVLAFLTGIQGKRAAIGIEEKDWTQPTSDSDEMAQIAGTGGYPSFWSGDFGFGGDLDDMREALVKAAEAQWAKGQ
ncbi:MAG TPA: hypothetical protein VIA18_05695, partial [Polyangia bacterium]|nr:hypothetical protein [Polyangia bacterium]